jgi:hypothetical protein
MAKRKAKPKPPPQDGGLNPKIIKRIRSALRLEWSYTSAARRICIARATDKNGFGHCEECRRKVPKLYADHIKVMGDVLAPDYIKRMWCSSKHLQALCKRCHDRKTREERAIEKHGF